MNTAEQRDTAHPKRSPSGLAEFHEWAHKTDQLDAILLNQINILKGDLERTKAHAQRLAKALKSLNDTVSELEGVEIEYPLGMKLARASQNAAEALAQWKTAQK